MQIQQIFGRLLYYTCALHNTLHVASNTISQTQAKPTTTTNKLCDHLLNYCTTKPNVGLRYIASNMTLVIHSDASFLVAPEAKSCIVGVFSLQQPLHTSTQNTLILVECETLKHVVTSAAEYETTAVFYNSQQAIPI